MHKGPKSGILVVLDLNSHLFRIVAQTHEHGTFFNNALDKYRNTGQYIQYKFLSSPIHIYLKDKDFSLKGLVRAP